MEAQEMDARQLLFWLLGKKKRRRQLLLRWHTCPPNKKEGVREILREFLCTLLYATCAVELLNDRLLFFGMEHGNMCARRRDLRPDELSLLELLPFTRKDTLVNGHVRCHGLPFALEIPVEWRRAMVRDFATFVATAPPKSPARAAFVPLLFAVQDLIPSGDPFVGQLAFALREPNARLPELLAWDTFRGDEIWKTRKWTSTTTRICTAP